MPHKILIVDDEPMILDILSFNLTQAGYKVFTANNGKEAVSNAEKYNPDLILLDIMMPIMDGITAANNIRSLKTLKNTKIIFLTASIDEDTEIEAFNLGANDFINKPIKPKVLISRINAIFRNELNGKDISIINEIVINDLTIDKKTYTVTKSNTAAIKLPRKEFELLYLLALKPDTVHSRNTLLDSIWGTDVYVVDRTVDVHIRKIREKIGEEYIETIKGVGYLFKKYK